MRAVMGNDNERKTALRELRKIKEYTSEVERILGQSEEGREQAAYQQQQAQGAPADAGDGSGAQRRLPSYEEFIEMTLDNRQDIQRILADKTLGFEYSLGG